MKSAGCIPVTIPPMKRLWMPAVVLIFLLALYTLFKYAKNYDAADGLNGRVPGSLDGIGMLLENSHVIIRTDGTPDCKFQVSRMELRSQPGSMPDVLQAINLRNVHNGMFYRGGKPEAAFSAGLAQLDPGAQRITILGDIRLSGMHGEKLTAQECRWQRQDKFIQLKGKVLARLMEGEVSCGSMLFNPRERMLQCPEGADGVFEGFHLKADSLFWDINRGRVQCPTSVSGVRGPLTFSITSAELNLKQRRLIANKGIVRIRIDNRDNAMENLP